MILVLFVIITGLISFTLPCNAMEGIPFSKEDKDAPLIKRTRTSSSNLLEGAYFSTLPSYILERIINQHYSSQENKTDPIKIGNFAYSLKASYATYERIKALLDVRAYEDKTSSAPGKTNVISPTIAVDPLIEARIQIGTGFRSGSGYLYNFFLYRHAETLKNDPISLLIQRVETNDEEVNQHPAIKHIQYDDLSEKLPQKMEIKRNNAPLQRMNNLSNKRVSAKKTSHQSNVLAERRRNVLNKQSAAAKKTETEGKKKPIIPIKAKVSPAHRVSFNSINRANHSKKTDPQPKVLTERKRNVLNKQPGSAKKTETKGKKKPTSLTKTKVPSVRRVSFDAIKSAPSKQTNLQPKVLAERKGSALNKQPAAVKKTEVKEQEKSTPMKTKPSSTPVKKVTASPIKKNNPAKKISTEAKNKST